MWNKGEAYIGAVYNTLGIIHKDLECENIPNIRGKPTISCFSQQALEKNCYPSSRQGVNNPSIS